MKILMCNTFQYLRGGAERCVFGLTRLLTEQGHQVVPFGMHDPRNQPSEYDDFFVSHIDFPTELSGESGVAGKLRVLERVVYSREARRNIEALIEQERPDLVHVHGIAHEISPSILPGIKKYGIPIVQTLHDYKLVCPNTSFVSNNTVCEKCQGHRYYQVMLNRCKRGSLPASVLAGIEAYAHHWTGMYTRNVDLFISPSEFLKQKLQQFGIENRIETIPNFIDLDQFEPVTQKEDYFVFIGRLVAVKGVRTLVRAMRQVKNGRLLIAGTGELEAELKAYCAEHQLDNVTFLGHLNTDALVPLLQKARFSIVPSEWYENYSMAVIESFACGTAVVGANIGGIPEQVLDGQTGRLFPSGDEAALAALLNDLAANPSAAQEMGQQARRFVEETNSPEAHLAATMRLYQTLLPEHALSVEG